MPLCFCFPRKPLLALLLLSAVLPAQIPREPEPRLPDGKSQRDAILRSEHRKALADAAKLLKLAEELNEDLEKFPPNVLSVGTLRKTEDIEKLAKKIRSRLKQQ